jgi:hypothetical protein
MDQDRMGWSRTEWDGTRQNKMEQDGTGWNGTEWDGNCQKVNLAHAWLDNTNVRSA